LVAAARRVLWRRETAAVEAVAVVETIRVTTGARPKAIAITVSA